MAGMGTYFRRLIGDDTGTMAIETAVVAPVLVIMAVGGFEASGMVARQSELQSSVAEAVAISLAAPPENYQDIGKIRDVIKMSTGLDNDHVWVFRLRRCGTTDHYVVWEESCGSSERVSTFLYIYITDTYTPQWVNFGIGEPMTYRIRRTVQIS